MTAEASATEETAEPGGAGADLPRHARPPSWPVSVLRTARPRQWPKNLLVFAAPLAGATWGRPHGALYASVAAAAFTFASVAVYFINDVVDAERDRRHPRKRYRPVAAGDLPKWHAIVIGVACAVIGVAAGLAVSVPLLTAAVGAYLGISFLYSFVLKHIPVIELIFVASGFLLRVLGGAVALFGRGVLRDLRARVLGLARAGRDGHGARSTDSGGEQEVATAGVRLDGLHLTPPLS